MSSSKAYSVPTEVQPIVELNTSLSAKLALGKSYLAAQQEADPENKLGPQATALRTICDTIDARLELKGELDAKAETNNAEITRSIGPLNRALVDYGRAAARFAGTDPVLLGSLGVTAAKKRAPKGSTPVPEAPTNLVISAGATPGEVALKCRKVAHAGAYVFEYKLEPSQPTDPWLPNGGIQTMLVSATVSRLAPSQQIRARVRAIGAMIGPWSEEVVGRAR